MIRIFSTATACAMLAACATSGQTDALPEGETSIPFIASANAINWKAASDDSLYVQGPNNDWYFVRTQGNCPRLRSALGLGFETSAGGQLDRFGAIRVGGSRCAVSSVVRSGPPPAKAE